MAVCNSCKATIWWALTPSGKSMPINEKPDPNGTVTTDQNGIVEIITDPAEQRLARKRGRKFYTAHFATCPAADKHRRRRG